MGKNWFLYLLGLGGTVVFHAYYFGWYSWFLLVLMVCLPLFSLLVSLPAMIRVRLRLDVPEQCTREQPAYVTMGAANGFLPLPRCRFRLTAACCAAARKRAGSTIIWDCCVCQFG